MYQCLLLRLSLQEDLPLFGRPEITCSFSLSKRDRGLLAARLTDIFPEGGGARLVTHAVRNFSLDESGTAVHREVGMT